MTSMKVCCRFRPQNKLEKSVGGYKVIQISEDGSIVRVTPPPESSYSRAVDFNFDKCFDIDSPQPIVFEFTAKHLVDQVFGGFNATIFAYGQTGAGKTYSMEGQIGSPNRGIVPRVVETIFEAITEADEGLEFLLKVSYVEIYLEGLRDLINPSNSGMKIREGKHGVYIEGVTQMYVRDATEVMGIMELGSGNRTVNATNMNATSSRSHGVFMLTLESKALDTGSKKMAKLMMVDLAGSEKISKTGASGLLLEEAKKINQSLSALGNVMNALSSGKGHVSYRDSVLTRLLSDSLGGNCKTTLLIACSCSSYNADETISTLRFGTRAKKIKNKAKINAEKSVAEYKKEVAALQAKIVKYKTLVAAYKADMAAVKNGDFDGNSMAEAYLAGEAVTVPVEEEKTADSSGAAGDDASEDAATEDAAPEDDDMKYDEDGHQVDLDGQLVDSSRGTLRMDDAGGPGSPASAGSGGGGGGQTVVVDGVANERLQKENEHLKRKVDDLTGQIRKLAQQLQIRAEKLANERSAVEDTEIEYSKVLLSNRALTDSLAAMENEKNRIEREKMESDARAEKKSSETAKLREKITLLKAEAERSIRAVRHKEQIKAEEFIRTAQEDLRALKRRATHGARAGGSKATSVVQMERAMRQQVKQERRNLTRHQQEMDRSTHEMEDQILQMKTTQMQMENQLQNKIDEYLNLKVAMSEKDDEINGLRLELQQKERKMRTQNAELQALGHLKLETDKYHHSEAAKTADKIAALERQIIKMKRLNERNVGGFGSMMGGPNGGTMNTMNIIQSRQKQAVAIPLRGGGGRQENTRGGRVVASGYNLPNPNDFDMNGGSFAAPRGRHYTMESVGGMSMGGQSQYLQMQQNPHGRQASYMSAAAYSANPYGMQTPQMDEYGLGAPPSPSPQPYGGGPGSVIINGSYQTLPHMPEDEEYAQAQAHAQAQAQAGAQSQLTAARLQAQQQHRQTPSSMSRAAPSSGGKGSLPRGSSNSTFVTHGRQFSNASFYKSRNTGGTTAGNSDSFWG